jgi:hypothetical protein
MQFVHRIFFAKPLEKIFFAKHLQKNSFVLLMVCAYNVLTNAIDDLSSPDEERNKTVLNKETAKEEKLWIMSRCEVWGVQRLTVYRSPSQNKLAWYEPKTKTWAVLEGYDQQKEHEDEDYAKYIYEVMSRPYALPHQLLNAPALSSTVVTRSTLKHKSPASSPTVSQKLQCVEKAATSKRQSNIKRKFS